MRTIIFSDTHLTERFDPKKFNFLYDICESAERIIINGDFWESWFVDPRKFINSKWSSLFRLLKSKDTTYIYGNHDLKVLSEEVGKYFSNSQLESTTLKVGKEILHIEHGQRLFRTFDAKVNNIKILAMSKYLILASQFILDSIFSKLFGDRRSDHKHQQIMNNRDNYLKNNYILVCGHVHTSYIDMEQKYLNSGSILYGKASYIQIENDKIELIKTTY